MSGIVRLPSGDILTFPSAGIGAVSTVTTPVDASTAVADSASGHILASGASAPAGAAGANNGTSPPAPTMAGLDTRGGAQFGSGGSPAAGAQVVVTFGTAFAAAPIVVLTARNTATQALGLYVSSVGTTGFTISTTSAPTASQGGTVYSVGFIALG